MPKVRPLLIAVWIVAMVAPLALASGDLGLASSTVMANRFDPPQTQIKRILLSDRTDKARLAALAKFVQIGDTENALRMRLGEPIQEDRLPFSGKALYYRSYLMVVLKKEKVVAIGRFAKGFALFSPGDE
jgi:hypothetical protein